MLSCNSFLRRAAVHHTIAVRCVSSLGSQQAHAQPREAPRTQAEMPSQLMTESQRQQFVKDGYLKMDKSFLTAEQRRNVIDWAKDLQTWPETAGKWMQYFESRDGDRLLCRMENFLQYHDGIRDLVRGKITKAVSELMGEDAILYKEKINFKLPGAAGFNPHQDAPAYVTFGMKFHVTCFITADAATPENGCLEVVPGYQSLGMLPHPNGEIEPSLSAKWEAEGRWKKLLCDPGDVVFFDSYIPHRSGPNVSKNSSRSIYYLTFNPTRDGDRRDGYFSTKRKSFPPDIERTPGHDYSEGAKVFNVSNPIPVR